MMLMADQETDTVTSVKQLKRRLKAVVKERDHYASTNVPGMKLRQAWS